MAMPGGGGRRGRIVKAPSLLRRMLAVLCNAPDLALAARGGTLRELTLPKRLFIVVLVTQGETRGVQSA